MNATEQPGRLGPLAVTLGDPAGVGPEVAVRAALDWRGARPLVLLGDRGAAERTLALLGASAALKRVACPSEAAPVRETLWLLENAVASAPPAYGAVSAEAGAAALAAIEAGVRCCLSGTASALVTAPIHKEAIAAAGSPYPGHTEMLAALAGRETVAMMLVNEDIRTVLVSIHCALSEAIAQVTPDAELRAIRFAAAGARAFGVARPRVAVAGLNPHAGEGGLFGREEIEVIAPAIAAARAEGIDASGPWPGDTVFMEARQGRFDVVVAQYHDQGLIPVKYLGLEQGVNVTLGLPFPRTSPDHGTAFAIAGQGVADASSMRAALAAADRLATAQKFQEKTI